MIRINLLPGAEKKGRAAGRAAAPVAAGGGSFTPLALIVLVLFLGVDGFLFWRGYTTIQTSEKRIVEKKAEQAKIEKETAELGPEAVQIEYEMRLFDAQLEILKSLDNRILWSQKLNMLAKLIPPSVFLSEISITENFREVEIKSSIEARKKFEEGRGKTKDRGEKPEVVKKPVVSYTLRLSGLATGPDSVQQLDNVSKFHDALVSFEEKTPKGETVRFMDNMKPTIEFEFVEAYMYERKYQVQRFAFKLNSVALGDDEAAEGAEMAGEGKKGKGKK